MAVDGPVRHVVVRVLVTLRRSCIVCTDIPQIHWDHDVCAFAWNGCKTGKGAGKRGPNGAGTWCRGKGPDEWASGMRDGVGKKGGKKGFKGSKPDCYGDKDKGYNGNTGNGKGKGKSETETCCELRRARSYRSELSIRVDKQRR